MTTYRDYQLARDTAWQALLQLPEKRLPVDVDALARAMGAEVLPFPKPEEKRLFALVERAKGGPCVSLRIRRQWNIFMDEKHRTASARRFAVAREVGRILLSQETVSLAPGVRCFACRECPGDLMDDPQEMDDYMADMFAVRLLAPACLLHELHIDASGRITELCGLPPHAAAVRAERMELLNERDVYYTHMLEVRVRDAFRPWLLEQKGLSPAPPQAAVRLKYASESTERMEIHGSLPDLPPWEENAERPGRSFLEAPPIRKIKPPKPNLKTAAVRFLRRNKKKLLIALALLIAWAVLYWAGGSRQ